MKLNHQEDIKLLKIKKASQKLTGFFTSSGNWTRTSDLRVMSLKLNKG